MILFTGADGQLGQQFRALTPAGAVFAAHQDLDITDEPAVRSFLADHRVDLVVNCAGYSAVDRAESEREAAMRVNGCGAGVLARCAKRIIHISTDYVFDGNKGEAYCEEDPVHPLSAYGRSKARGEELVLKEAQTALVVRTSWLFSPFGNNFVRTMRRLGAQKPEIRVVDDQTGSPTYARDLACAILALIPQIPLGMKGIWHCAGTGFATWREFAEAVMEESHLPCRVRAIRSSEYPSAAQRPPCSILDSSKISKDFGIVMPHWRDSLRRCICLMDSVPGR